MKSSKKNACGPRIVFPRTTKTINSTSSSQGPISTEMRASAWAAAASPSGFMAETKPRIADRNRKVRPPAMRAAAPAASSQGRSAAPVQACQTSHRAASRKPARSRMLA